jgi:hypothetical protein
LGERGGKGRPPRPAATWQRRSSSAAQQRRCGSGCCCSIGGGSFIGLPRRACGFGGRGRPKQARQGWNCAGRNTGRGPLATQATTRGQGKGGEGRGCHRALSVHQRHCCQRQRSSSCGGSLLKAREGGLAARGAAAQQLPASARSGDLGERDSFAVAAHVRVDDEVRRLSVGTPAAGGGGGKGCVKPAGSWDEELGLKRSRTSCPGTQLQRPD